MPEPQVRYVRTEDGVNIAYYTLGSGPPLLWLSIPQTHLLEEWRVPEIRTALENTAQFFTLIRMDPRGFGLSDRDAPDINFVSMAGDIRAVMNAITPEPAIVLGMALAVHPAVIYAATHPEQVSHLVLLSPGVTLRGSRSARLDSLYELAQVDWEFASETIQRSFWDMESELVKRLARVLRESVTPSTLFELTNETERNFDATEFMERLEVPTLVLHDRSNRNVAGDGGRRTAAIIPNARFVEIDSPWLAARAIARFLAETGAAPPRPSRVGGSLR